MRHDRPRSKLSGKPGQGHWLGRTHIQKGAYFVQEFAGVDLGYEFVIYQYGPYSFDLDSDVSDLLSAGALQMETVGGYPDYSLGSSASVMEERNPPSILAKDVMGRVASAIAHKPAKELELLATIAFVRRSVPNASTGSVTRRVHSLKPHFDNSEIREASDELDQILNKISTAA